MKCHRLALLVRLAAILLSYVALHARSLLVGGLLVTCCVTNSYSPVAVVVVVAVANTSMERRSNPTEAPAPGDAVAMLFGFLPLLP